MGEKLAAGDARFGELFRLVTEARGDAREARDGMLRIETILEQQNIGQQIADVRQEGRANIAALRDDFVGANTRLKAELTKFDTALQTETSAFEARLKVVEDARTKVVGVADFFQYAAKIAPWLLTIGAAFWAGVNRHH